MFKKTIVFSMVLLLTVLKTDSESISKAKTLKINQNQLFIPVYRKIHKAHEINYHLDPDGKNIPQKRIRVYSSEKNP